MTKSFSKVMFRSNFAAHVINGYRQVSDQLVVDVAASKTTLHSVTVPAKTQFTVVGSHFAACNTKYIVTYKDPYINQDVTSENPLFVSPSIPQDANLYLISERFEQPDFKPTYICPDAECKCQFFYGFPAGKFEFQGATSSDSSKADIKVVYQNIFMTKSSFNESITHINTREDINGSKKLRILVNNIYVINPNALEVTVSPASHKFTYKFLSDQGTKFLNIQSTLNGKIFSIDFNNNRNDVLGNDTIAITGKLTETSNEEFLFTKDQTYYIQSGTVSQADAIKSKKVEKLDEKQNPDEKPNNKKGLTKPILLAIIIIAAIIGIASIGVVIFATVSIKKYKKGDAQSSETTTNLV